MPDTRFSASRLADFARSAYQALDLTEADADLVADTLVQADLWGHPSHGVMRTFWYAKRILSGATNIKAGPELVVDGGAMAVVDGHDGIGQSVAAYAMRQAIDRARAHGVGAVSVRNSGHFGTAMYFTRLAAMANCVAFLSTNASPAMAPWGGREKRIGTNPWSIAAPAGRNAPMMLDIANTAVARGKLYVAQQCGEPIPDGWALDADGNPTNDAAAGIAGIILPFAEHKGYAIATMMDVLSGVLSGSGFGETIVGPYVPEGRSGVGHFMVVMNIAAFRPVSEFHADMDALISGLKNTPKSVGTEEIFYPGELEARSDAEQRLDGIVLPSDTISDLDDGARKLGIKPLSS